MSDSRIVSGVHAFNIGTNRIEWDFEITGIAPVKLTSDKQGNLYVSNDNDGTITEYSIFGQPTKIMYLNNGSPRERGLTKCRGPEQISWHGTTSSLIAVYKKKSSAFSFKHPTWNIAFLRPDPGASNEEIHFDCIKSTFWELLCFPLKLLHRLKKKSRKRAHSLAVATIVGLILYYYDKLWIARLIIGIIALFKNRFLVALIICLIFVLPNHVLLLVVTIGLFHFVFIDVPHNSVVFELRKFRR